MAEDYLSGRGIPEKDYGQKHTFSSGIECIILPFPALRFEKLQKATIRKFPMPKPPKKKIKTVDGTETIDDTSNEKYVAKKEKVEQERDKWLSEKILTIAMRDCVELDIDQYEDVIKELEDDLGESYPENQFERKIEFMKDYVFRSASDFQAIIGVTLELMRVSPEEVSTQVDEIFPSDVAQSEGNGTETSRPDEVESLEVQ